MLAELRKPQQARFKTGSPGCVCSCYCDVLAEFVVVVVVVVVVIHLGNCSLNRN